MTERIDALKEYFSTPNKPVTPQELFELRKASPEGFDELANKCLEALKKEREGNARIVRSNNQSGEHRA